MPEKPEAESQPEEPTSLLTPEVAEMALQLLDRVTVQGRAEVRAFQRVQVALESVAMRG